MFENLCIRLFGEEKENQKKMIVMLTLISGAAFIIASIFNIGGSIAIPFLIWGWRALIAFSGINQISKFFNYNIVVIVILLVLWLTLGMFAGVAICLIGLIRLVQIEIINHNQKQS